MRKIILIISILFIYLNNCQAQVDKKETENLKSNHFSVGYNLNEFGSDFGLGINITSPFFAGKTMAVRASENYQWLNHLDDKGKYTWTGYHNIRLGVASGGYILNNAMRLYGEGGVTFLISPASLTSKTNIGGYGMFGFEFFLSNGFSYFIELGGIGVGASAENAPLAPIYSNGFMSSVGFRIYM